MQDKPDYPQKLSRLSFFSRREAAEIPKLLMPGEQVLSVLSGFYSSGTAILCVTSKRLLLVDKKLVRLSFEDVRFEAIKEVRYSHQMYLASVEFYYAGRSQPLQFRSWFRVELRMLAQFVQNKMFEEREQPKLPQADPLIQSPQQSSQAAEQIFRPTTPTPAPFEYNTQMEQYLQDRIARWRRATRFVDSLPNHAHGAVTGLTSTLEEPQLN